MDVLTPSVELPSQSLRLYRSSPKCIRAWNPCTLLAFLNRMIRHVPVVMLGAVGALYLRERRSRLRLERLGAATLETLLDAIDANNPDTGEHVRRVARYAL